MPRLFIGNFAFEDELAGHRQNLPARLLRLEAELAPCWAAVAEESDVIWCPVAPTQRLDSPAQTVSAEADIPQGLELVPWGWTDSVRAWGRRVRALVTSPPSDAVETANSRRFALSLESEWECGLAGATIVSSMSELEDRLTAIDSQTRWIVRTNHSGAARNRLLGAGRDLSPADAGWVCKRLAQDEFVIWEPWVDRIAEVSLHWTIPVDTAPRFDGLTGLVTDHAGRYLGSLFGPAAPSIEEWAEAVDLTGRLARELQQLGYSGPLGVDVLRYHDADGEIHLRPLQDVNARWTMGRLSLGWQKRFPSGLWRHGTIPDMNEAERQGRLLLKTSPEHVDNDLMKHCTWIESTGD